jgi:hypothetical protein
MIVGIDLLREWKLLITSGCGRSCLVSDTRKNCVTSESLRWDQDMRTHGTQDLVDIDRLSRLHILALHQKIQKATEQLLTGITPHRKRTNPIVNVGL